MRYFSIVFLCKHTLDGTHITASRMTQHSKNMALKLKSVWLLKNLRLQKCTHGVVALHGPF